MDDVLRQQWEYLAYAAGQDVTEEQFMAARLGAEQMAAATGMSFYYAWDALLKVIFNPQRIDREQLAAFARSLSSL